MISAKEAIIDYGKYCGLGHSNTDGDMPIDLLDRYCQIHDICVTAIPANLCFCNEQLYYLVSNFFPTDDASSSEKNAILTFMYLAIAGCPNHNLLDRRFVISADRGYNFLPIYPNYSQAGNLIDYNAITVYTSGISWWFRTDLTDHLVDEIDRRRHTGEYTFLNGSASIPIDTTTIVIVSEDNEIQLIDILPDNTCEYECEGDYLMVLIIGPILGALLIASIIVIIVLAVRRKKGAPYEAV